MMDKKIFTILCVDDEKSILNALKRLLRKEGYNLLFANSGKEGLEILAKQDVEMVISDQRMPEMSGTEFLAKVKENYPDILRIILTGYSDIESITESINKGNIFKFFFKPWNDIRLKAEIRQVFEQLELIQTNKQLDQTVARQNRELQEINENLEKLVKERTHEIELQNHMLQLSHAILDDLPISVMGIDNQGMVVMTNKMAQSMVCKNGIKLGSHLSDFFSEEVTDTVHQVIETGEQANIDGKVLSLSVKDAVLLPLTGRFKGKGVIMTMHP